MRLIIIIRLNYVRETDYVSAAFALVRRNDFVRLNMFDGALCSESLTIALALVVLVVRVVSFLLF